SHAARLPAVLCALAAAGAKLMLTVLLVIAGLALLWGARHQYSARKSPGQGDALIMRIDALLPQTQCGKCGYPGCRPYAAAIASGEADINQCPPGGDAGIRALANLLGVEYKPLNTGHGLPTPKARAVIDENICIGCTLCLQACPVDAILGAPKNMHTVIASECTGCELCVAPCPVDCISMQPIAETSDNLLWRYIPLIPYYRRIKSVVIARKQGSEAANVARARYEFRLLRLQREKQERAQKQAQKVEAARAAGATAGNAAEAAKKAAIAAAIERVRVQKAKAQLLASPRNTSLPPAVQDATTEVDPRQDAAAPADEKLEKLP
ncbi:MAG TPA: electron transport complex subunit RsxB, partial [Methylophilaceae bacterium]|nr:electron transport complex subunit RsxB [Methylophilaceae bacterium]